MLLGDKVSLSSDGACAELGCGDKGPTVLQFNAHWNATLILKCVKMAHGLKMSAEPHDPCALTW
jgi:hypothetical protein